MSDEEDESFSSPEEGFSASEDEWKPSKETRGGESSDDDDSDFDSVPNVSGAAGAANKKREPKGRSAIKQQVVKKRKSSMQSLRSKLYNKYKPPPKTLPGRGENNSPSASTSKPRNASSKNSRAPNDDSDKNNDDDDDDDVSSESSVEDYLVNPAELDLKSSFFDVTSAARKMAPTPPPQFDCNAGTHLSDSDSEDNNESSGGDQTHNKAFDFRNLLEKATSLERVKETMAKRAAATTESPKQVGVAGGVSARSQKKQAAMDVESLLALGENQTIGDEDKGGRLKLRQTKSTRQKRHTKTRPISSVGAGANSEDSDWEEVADEDRSNSDDSATASSKNNSSNQAHDFSRDENLEIHIEMPNRRSNKDRKQQDLEMALKRKINRDIKERQLLLHKTSLLCCFARSYLYNHLLNETALMHEALKLLPSKNSYPPERGTELKYYQSLVTWFKTAIKLKSNNLYPVKAPKRGKEMLKQQLCEQIKKKEASCKQDMIFIFVILLRGMGLQCRLVVNMQPLPIRPAQSDLCTIKLKKPEDDEEKGKDKSKSSAKKAKSERTLSSEGEESAKKNSSKSNKSSKEKSSSKANEKTSTQLENHKKKEKAKKVNGTEDVALNIKEEKPNLENIKQETSKGKEIKMTDLPGVNDIKLKLEEIIGRKLKGAIESETKVKEEQEESSEKTLVKPSKRADSQKNTTEPKEVEQNNDEVRIEETEEPKAKKRPQRAAKQSAAKNSSKDSKANDELEEAEFNEILTESMPVSSTKPSFSKLKRSGATAANPSTSAESKRVKQIDVPVTTPIARRTRQASSDQQAVENQKPIVEIGSPVLPKAVRQSYPAKTNIKTTVKNAQSALSSTQDRRSKSKSPKPIVSTEFLQNKANKEKVEVNKIELLKPNNVHSRARSKSPNEKVKISPNFLKKNAKTVLEAETASPPKRVLRSRASKTNEVKIPQLDGADDEADMDDVPLQQRRKPQLKKLNKKEHSYTASDDADFEPSPPKRPKVAPVLKAVDRLRKDRRVLSTDDESSKKGGSIRKIDPTAGDMWIEVWSDVEDKWIPVDLFKGKLNDVDVIRKTASMNLAYVYAFQNDMSIKDITARYCSNWAIAVRKSRIDKIWLDLAISRYLGDRTKRDISEDLELRRIHEDKPLPRTISEYKDHPLYALERHLLKFQALYPPNPPTLGFIRGEAVYARECVYTLHSRETWLKEARTVKMGEQPYKIVGRPKWDRKSATSSFAYVYAFQNDLSMKDITARYCPHWTSTVRKSRVEKAWLDVAIASYLGRPTQRDMCEDVELRRIHEEKPMPTAIGDYKDHPLYALERHLLKFQALYPPDAPTLGFIRGEPVYARECVHTLHSREIWLKSARTVKLGEKPYKIVKARPKWDRITQTVIKDQPLEIFGFWQTQDYEPPTAENGLVPRNAYGNVELFKECMLPKKTVHLRLPGLNRVCKKLGIDCANAVIGFDFHQGACHPTYDGFVICEEFAETATAAWEQDQADQERKEQEKYESRVYGNWKKLIKGLLIRERLKKKYNF